MLEEQRKKFDVELEAELKRNSSNHEGDAKRLKLRLESEIDRLTNEKNDLADKARECQRLQDVAERTLHVEREQYNKKEQ